MSHLSWHICWAALQTKSPSGNSGPDPEIETGVTFRVHTRRGDFLKKMNIDYLNHVYFHSTSMKQLFRDACGQNGSEHFDFNTSVYVTRKQDGIMLRNEGY